jgi:hypothetical protein
MKVEAHAYLSEALFAASEEKVWQQIASGASFEGVVGAYLMPDMHVGYGVPVGSVIVTEDTLIQGGSGYDISCGVLYMKADRMAGAVTGKYARERWVRGVERRVATGSERTRARAASTTARGASSPAARRSEAKRKFGHKQDRIDAEMATVQRAFAGVTVEGIVGNQRHVPLDECAHVYKDLDEVLAVLEAAGIARVANRLYPVANIKGADCAPSGEPSLDDDLDAMMKRPPAADVVGARPAPRAHLGGDPVARYAPLLEIARDRVGALLGELGVGGVGAGVVGVALDDHALRGVRAQAGHEIIEACSVVAAQVRALCRERHARVGRGHGDDPAIAGLRFGDARGLLLRVALGLRRLLGGILRFDVCLVLGTRGVHGVRVGVLGVDPRLAGVVLRVLLVFFGLFRSVRRGRVGRVRGARCDKKRRKCGRDRLAEFHVVLLLVAVTHTKPEACQVARGGAATEPAVVDRRARVY